MTLVSVLRAQRRSALLALAVLAPACLAIAPRPAATAAVAAARPAPPPGTRPSTAAAPTPHAAAAPAPAPGEYPRLVTLPNGLRVLLAPDSQATAVDVAVWYDAGARHERPGIVGMSHLIERLMFRGSARHGAGEHGRLVAAEGGSSNANSTHDYACFYETIPAEALDLALSLEADRMGSLLITQAQLDAQRQATREDLRRSVLSRPVPRAITRLYSLAYTVHPYRWPVLGLDDDLKNITLEQCKSFYRAHYAPNTALLTLVGAFDAERALRLVRQRFGPLPRRTVEGAAPAVAREPAQTAERRAVEPAPSPLPLLVVAWRAPGDGDPDAPAFELLSRILTATSSARVQRALIGERRLCLSVQGGLDGRRDSQLLTALAVTRPDADSAEVESALIGEVEKLASEAPSGEELDRARRQEQFATLYGSQTARGRAQALGAAQMVDGDWHAAAARLERLAQLTPADVQRAAARILSSRTRSVVWVRPAGPMPGGASEGGGGGP